MTIQSIQKEIDREKDRQSRIDKLINSSLPHQLQRLEDVKRRADQAIRQTFGYRLKDVVIDRILDSLVLEPEVLAHIGGATIRELPEDSDGKGWNQFVQKLVDKEPIARLNIESSDMALRETLRQKYLAEMKPSDRMAGARAGTLDAALDAKVTAEIQRRSGIYDD